MSNRMVFLRVVHDCVVSGHQYRAQHGVFSFMHQVESQGRGARARVGGSGGGGMAVSRGNTLAGMVHAPWVSLVFKSTSESHKTVVSGFSSRQSISGRESEGGGAWRQRNDSLKSYVPHGISVAAKNVIITVASGWSCVLLLPLWVSYETAPVAASCQAAKGPEERACTTAPPAAAAHPARATHQCGKQSSTLCSDSSSNFRRILITHDATSGTRTQPTARRTTRGVGWGVGRCLSVVCCKGSVHSK